MQPLHPKFVTTTEIILGIIRILEIILEITRILEIIMYNELALDHIQ